MIPKACRIVKIKNGTALANSPVIREAGETKLEHRIGSLSSIYLLLNFAMCFWYQPSIAMTARKQYLCKRTS
jgi:hypothetical protein